MPRPKGLQNKLTTEIKDWLQKIMDDTVDSLLLDDMNTNQKLKLLQLGLQYIMPKLQSTTIHPDNSAIDEPLFIEVCDRKPDSNEEVWKDNFELKNRYEIGKTKWD